MIAISWQLQAKEHQVKEELTIILADCIDSKGV
jgi:hypothetical protein